MKLLILSLVLLLCSAATGNAISYSFVGSWRVSDGPVWDQNPAVYSGREAAALIFGGSASDYAISTISSDSSLINFKTLLDGWGDSQYLLTAQDQDWKVDLDEPGYNNNKRRPGAAYSAFVKDHAGVDGVNYAFRIDNSAEAVGPNLRLLNRGDSSVPVPEPGTRLLLGAGLTCLAIYFKRRNNKIEA